MSILLLMLLALVAMQKPWPPPPEWIGPGGSGWTTLAGLASLFVVGSLYTSYCCRAMRADPANRRQVLRRFHSRQKLYFMALIGYFLAALYLFGWGSTFLQPASAEGPQFPGATLLVLAPLLAILICSWARLYDVERTAHDLDAAQRAEMMGEPAPATSTFPGRGSYLALQVRLNLLLIVPPLAVILLQESVFWLQPELRKNAYFLPLFMATLLVVALLSMPWLLRLFLGLKPLPAGPLRDRLEAAARRLRFRCSDILLWNTRNSMANAMVTGLVPWGRFIVLTDRLLYELRPDEVEAVLGHEIGHVKHHHMFFYTLFLMGSLFAIDMLWETGEPFLKSVAWPDGWLENFQMYAAFPALFGVALYLFFVFGFLSRHCERQADIYGCRAVSSQAFISALEKVALLNGIPREKPGWLSSWRHPTIARRVEFIQRIEENPELEPRFQRRVGWVKWSMSLVLTLVLGGMAIATYPTWSAFLTPPKPADRPAKDKQLSHDEIPTLHISDQARKNLKIETKRVQLVQKHQRKISVPAVVVERPGSCERLVSSPVGGVIQRIASFRGEVVHPGETLFTIELISEKLHAQQADLFKTARELALVKLEKERLQKLLKDNVLPMHKWIDVENQHQRLTDSILAREQELAVRGFSKADLDKVKKGQFLREVSVAVPSFAGGHVHPGPKGESPSQSPALHTGYEVEEMKVMLGEQVQPGQPLCVLADHYHLFIEGKVFAAETGWVQQAAKKGLSIGAHFTQDTENVWPSWHDDLKIVNLANRMDQASQTLSFFLTLPNQFHEYERDGKRYRLWRFRPGQRAVLSVPVQVWPEPGDDHPQPIFVLPAQAIVHDGPDVFVFREKDGNDNVFERVSVQLLYEDQRNAVIAHDGSVQEGQQLAMNGAVQLNWAFKAQNNKGGAQGATISIVLTLGA